MEDNNHFLGKKLVVFTAHPDDEQLAAGTMYENHVKGGKTYLICATFGEKGKSHLKKEVSDEQLKHIREKELLGAAKILKVDEVFFLDIPDGKVRENEEKVYEKSLPIIKKIMPEHMLSFGPDGISAHWDHITAGKVALRIAKELSIPLAAFTLSEENILARKTNAALVLSRRKFGVYNGIPEHRSPEISIKIRADIKSRAMALHVSQFGRIGKWIHRLPVFTQRKRYGHEHFVNEKI